MRRFATVAVLLLCAVFLVAAAPVPEPVQLAPIRTEKQHALHAAADILRAAGYVDEDPEIRALSAAWFAEQEALDIVAKVVKGEAEHCPAEHQIAVAAVVVNRVRDPRFPATVREVVAAPMQYSTSYLSGFAGTPRSCYEAAKIALDGADGVPDDVVWQAQFPQGRETWWISDVDTGWFRSTTWFCR